MYQRFDDIDTALQAILVFYGIHADIAGLRRLYFDNKAELNDEDLRRLMKEAGLDAEEVTNTPSAIQQSGYPAILLLKDRKHATFFPNQSYLATAMKGKMDSTEADISDYTGTAYIFRPLDKNAAEEDVQRLGWFWNPIRQNASMFKEVSIASLFINLLALAIPIYTMNVYDRVVHNFSMPTLVALTTGVVLAIIIDFLLRAIRAFILESASSKLSVHYDGLLMERLSLIPSNRMQMTTGEKVHLFHEMQGVRDYYAGKLLPTLVDTPFLVLYLLAIFMVSPVLVLVPIVFSLIIMALNMLSWKFYDDLNHQAFRSGQRFTSLLYEMLEGLSTTRLSNAAGSRLHRWKMSLLDNAKVRRKLSYSNGLIQTGSSSLVYLCQIAVVFFGIFEIQSGDVTMGGLVAISLLSSRVLSPVLSLGATFSQYKKSRDLLMALNKVFTMPHEGERAGRLSSKWPLKGDIRIEDATFMYPQGAKPAITGITLNIKAGDKIGLIGPNGAGKSTLAQLMAGLLEPQKGNLFLGNHLYAAISPFDLRRAIGFVPQKPFLFAGTVRDNIIMGETGLTQGQLDEAVHVSGLERTIAESGYGLDMEVGDDGEFLSAGQKQSLALARAIIHHPSVLILDEPTAGMDHMLESHLLSTLKTYLHDKTFIMVTHRTPLLPLVNRLILLTQGTVRADGPTADVLSGLEKGAGG